MKWMILILTFAAGLFAGSKMLSQETTGGDGVPVSSNPAVYFQRWLNQLSNSGDLESCAAPAAERLANCEQTERQLLATTVRFELYEYFNINGERFRQPYFRSHATIKDGRHLVTHNHLGDAFAETADDKDAGISRTIIFYDANGEQIWELPLSAVSVVARDVETTVLEITGDEPIFERAGLSPAEFDSWTSLPLEPGMEVAQVTWDGSVTEIQWVKIDAVFTNDGTARLELSDCVRSGSSGGGVFWNGVHIGNNWARAQSCDGDLMLGHASVVALNSTLIAD